MAAWIADVEANMIIRTIDNTNRPIPPEIRTLKSSIPFLPFIFFMFSPSYFSRLELLFATLLMGREKKYIKAS
jgi:hypothetical protein